jgi:endonuclease/exonuclease/phosphatase family metal-dependent hydrolase
MKIRTLVLIVASAAWSTCFAGGCASATPTPVRLTVVTYNIHHGGGADGKVDLPRLAEVIRKCEPDLVALQEVDNGVPRSASAREAADLGKLLGMFGVFGKAMDYQGGQYGDAVLSRFPIESSEVHHLPYRDGDKREPRCAVAATVALRDGRKIVFMSTHLDHTHEPSDRLAQAEELAAIVAKEKLPVILAGDFNCDPGTPPLETLAKEMDLVTKDEPPTCPADAPKETIDHVFVKPRGKWKVVETRVVEETIASDHRPVMVKLELAPQR